MLSIDKDFRKNKTTYIIQSGLATACVFLVLLISDVMSDAVIIATIGASSFIAFTMPASRASRPRVLIGGYVVGIIVGLICHKVSLFSYWDSFEAIRQSPEVIFGALSVGLTMLVMVVLDTEHPPAAGLALGLVLNSNDFLAVMVALIGIVLLTILKTILKPFLRDLR